MMEKLALGQLLFIAVGAAGLHTRGPGSKWGTLMLSWWDCSPRHAAAHPPGMSSSSVNPSWLSPLGFFIQSSR